MAKAEHEVVYEELTALMKRHADKMSAMEVLAVAANLVGKLIALQDQRKVTRAMAMEVVIKNIEMGNLQAIEAVANTIGQA